MGPGHSDYDIWGTDDCTAVCAAAMPFPVENRRNSMCHTVVINTICSCYSQCYFTFYGCGITSNGGGVVLVPEVLNNIRLASNAFKLCGATKRWCRYTAAPTYMVLKMDIMNKLKLYGMFDLSGGGNVYGVWHSPGGESQLVTSVA